MNETFFYINQYAHLAGWRLNVLASRLASNNDLSSRLHDHLLSGLQGAIETTRRIIALLKENATQAELEDDQIDCSLPCILAEEKQRLDSYNIEMLDELEIDDDTNEYRINGGQWHYALSADCDGVVIDYPKAIPLTETELGSLAPIIRGIEEDTGICITATRVDFA